MFDGTPESIRHADTLTGPTWAGASRWAFGFKRMVAESTPRLILEGAREHNLNNVSVEFPLQRMVCVTGVSGSGKSTLIPGHIAPPCCATSARPPTRPAPRPPAGGNNWLMWCLWTSRPSAKTARSNPVSYVGAWDAIRDPVCAGPAVQQRSYTGSKFSFNSGDGRCPPAGLGL